MPVAFLGTIAVATLYALQRYARQLGVKFNVGRFSVTGLPSETLDESSDEIVTLLRQSVREGAVEEARRVEAYLNRLNFFGDFGNVANYAPLQAFERAVPTVYGRYLREKWIGLLGRSSEADRAIDAAAEVFDNVFAHSKSPVGATATGQYFPRTGELHLTVVDLGIGIPRALAEARGRREDEVDAGRALRWALQQGTSSRPTARGLGLYRLQEFVRGRGGRLRIISGGAIATADRMGIADSRFFGWAFPGTAVDLVVP